MNHDTSFDPAKSHRDEVEPGLPFSMVLGLEWSSALITKLDQQPSKFLDHTQATTAKTQIIADGIIQARSMLTRIYGLGNVLLLQMVTDEDVTEGTKTLSAAELQVKSLADQSKRLNQQAKQLKARQRLKKAQEKFQSANM